jgi:hypothetical protein
LVASWFVPSEYDPASFLLTLLGIVGAFHSYVELRRAAEGEWEEASPYGDSAALDVDERRAPLQRPGPLRRWWQRRQEVKLQLRMQIERDEEERADEILARLHDGGLEALSATPLGPAAGRRSGYADSSAEAGPRTAPSLFPAAFVGPPQVGKWPRVVRGPIHLDA